MDIHYVARLARIELSPEEERVLSVQLGQILGYVEKLKQVDVAGVEPMSHAASLVNVMRPDEVRPSLPPEEAMSNAPAQSGGLFMMPKIVE
jgi:aspartyl-tRNA(Asn)/glutamyl-tRNA(Gln) amidotransferase subunit C